MTAQHHDPTVPRALLIGASALVIGTLLIVMIVRFTGSGAVRVPDAATVATLTFSVADQPDGSVVMVDALSGKLLDRVAPGTGGFVRGTMRGLARERQRQGIGADQPFHLIGRADGRLTLEDRTTGRRVDLESFGPTNAAVFSQLFNAPGSRLQAAAASEK